MKTILVIEDNLEIRENVTEILDISGYKVVTASNGEDGFKKANAQLPDLILCDIMMPVMDGYQLLQRLKENERLGKIPIVFLTAKSEPIDYNKAMSLGALDIIVKPFDGADLLEKLNKFFLTS